MYQVSQKCACLDVLMLTNEGFIFLLKYYLKQMVLNVFDIFVLLLVSIFTNALVN